MDEKTAPSKPLIDRSAGRTVPVRLGEGGPVIGIGKLLEDGHVDIRLYPDAEVQAEVCGGVITGVSLVAPA